MLTCQSSQKKAGLAGEAGCFWSTQNFGSGVKTEGGQRFGPSPSPCSPGWGAAHAKAESCALGHTPGTHASVEAVGCLGDFCATWMVPDCARLFLWDQRCTDVWAGALVGPGGCQVLLPESQLQRLAAAPDPQCGKQSQCSDGVSSPTWASSREGD